MKFKSLKFLFFYISLIKIVWNLCPTGKAAYSLNECTDFSDNNVYCCLLRSVPDQKPKMCYEYNKSKYTGQPTETYGIIEYKLDCGLNSTINGTYLQNSTQNTSILNNTISNSTNNNELQNNTMSNTSFPLNSNDTPSTMKFLTNESYYGIGGSTCGRLNPLVPDDCIKYSTSMFSCCYYNYNSTSGCYFIQEKFTGNYPFSVFPLLCEGGILILNKFMYIILILIYLNF
jgi:hypothetical protein